MLKLVDLASRKAVKLPTIIPCYASLAHYGDPIGQSPPLWLS